MRFQVVRRPNGMWQLHSPELTIESLFTEYATRRQAITAVAMMREAEMMAAHIIRHLDD